MFVISANKRFHSFIHSFIQDDFRHRRFYKKGEANLLDECRDLCKEGMLDLVDVIGCKLEISPLY